MAYPEDPLPVRVEIYLGSTFGWVDITDYVFVRDGGIGIRCGFGDESTRPEPSSATFALRNVDGRFSPRNPAGPYYGLIGRNTPTRISVGLLVDDFGTPVSDGWGDGWNLVDTGGAASDFDVSSGVGSIVVDGAPETRAAYAAGRSFSDVEVRLVAGIDDTNITGDAVVTGPILRVADADNYYWCAIRIFANEEMSIAVVNRSMGADADLVVKALSTSWDGTPLRVAFSAFRHQLRAKVWRADEPEPDEWTVEITDTAHADGSVGVRVATGPGNTDTPITFSFADFEARSYRYYGEVSEWPVRWDASGQDVWTPVTAQGILRRLQQGRRSVRSPFTSSVLGSGALAFAVEYWPMEDAAGATSFASALPGHAPLQSSGELPDPASIGPLLGSDKIPVLASTTTLSGTVSPYTDSGIADYGVRAILDIPPTPSWADNTPILWIYDEGSTGISRFEVRYKSSTGFLGVRALDANGSVLSGETVSNVDTRGKQIYLGVVFSDNGSGGTAVSGFYKYLDDDTGELTEAAFGTGDVAGAVLTRATRVVIAPRGGLAELAIGQLVVTTGVNSFDSDWFANSDVEDGLAAYEGETAAERAERLSEEAGVRFTGIYAGDASETEPMGRQPIPTTSIDALDETWRADLALLFESRHELGLVFRSRASLYNQSVALTLDYTALGELAPDLEPVDDDQRTRNDITVQRKNGSSARAVDTASRMGTGNPPAGVGRYEEQVEVNIQSDARLEHHAHWRLRLGTWDEPRYPQVAIDLAALATEGKHNLIAQICALKFGDRIRLTNLPVWVGTPDGNADLMVLGAAEQIGHPVEWRVVVNCAPYGPWQVGVYAADDATSADNPSRYQARGCVTRADFDTAADSTLLVDTPEGGFTDNPDALPYRIKCAGVVFEVTAVSAPGATQDLTVTVLNGVNKVIPAGSPVEIHYESYYAL